MAFAMRSLTDPPADMNSTLPTTKTKRKFSAARTRDGVLTEVASETIRLRDLVEADKGRVADAAERVVEDLGAHCAAVRGRREGCVWWFGGERWVSGGPDIGRLWQAARQADGSSVRHAATDFN